MSATTESKKGTGEASGSGTTGNEEEKKDDRTFECNICLDTARDAVVSMCGHLFWYISIFLYCFITTIIL